MRAYAVLAEIRDGRGDKKEADFFREVVKAIRLSETADKYYTAGLLKRAVQMYEDSLKHSLTPIASNRGWPFNLPSWAGTRRRKPTTGAPTS